MFTLHERTEQLEKGFVRIRRELDVPRAFPNPVQSQAEAAARRGPQLPPGAGGTSIADRRDLPFVAIDPPGSRDLDQAFCAERRGSGYRVFYAIADLAAFITPGSALDTEALERGVTLYSPDLRTSLHPEVINEGAASLLAGEDRQALVWTIDLDADGTLEGQHLERALVTNRRAITYAEAQSEINSGTAVESLALLKPIGELREAQERARGAISLQLPSQEVVVHGDAYRLVYDDNRPIEGWNAQISLLTGIAAAATMIDLGVGLLRTLPPVEEETLVDLRRTAAALDIDWGHEVTYADHVRTMDPQYPRQAAFLSRAARSLRGAGYSYFTDGRLPEMPEHSAIASTYAHVTAPLRRVCDRFTNEILLAAFEDRDPPDWALERLPDLPGVMGRARQRDRSLERSMVDFVEVVCLADRIGDEFDAVVLARGRNTSTLQLLEPAVMSFIDDTTLEVGAPLTVRLTKVDMDRRRLDFELA